MINFKINFLDFKIKLNNKKIFDIYDKRADFPFRINIFMDYNS